MVSPVFPLIKMLLVSTRSRCMKPVEKGQAFRSICSSLSSFESSSRHQPIAKITSTKSATVKNIQALLNRRKARYQQRQVVLEGPRMVLDLYQSRPQLIRTVVLDESLYSTFAPQLLGDDGSPSVKIVTASRAVLEACTDTVTNQGVLAVCDMPKVEDLHTTTDSSWSTSTVSLILDGVSDPGNFGTLLRSAAACGVVQSVYCLPHCCDPWNPKALRSAAGATFAIPHLESADSWQELRTTHLSPDTIVYAATMWDDRPSVPYYSATLYPQPEMKHGCAIVIGNEGQGLSDDVRLDSGVQAVHVPMVPGAVESLNAGVCGSILLFEALRQKELLQKKENN